MNDQPSAVELLRTVETFLEEQVVGALSGPAKFHARVAANVVAIVAREIETEEGHLAAEWQGQAGLLDDDAPPPMEREALRAALRARNEQLVARIRAGEGDSGPFREDLLAHLRTVVDAKLEVARPPRVARSRS